MSDATVLYEKTAVGVAWVTLNRPEQLNAINLRMRDELWDIMHAINDDPEVRVVILRGAGERAFSAGADISEFGTAPSYVAARRARRERDLWWYVIRMDKVLIAAIHGYALGAGVELPMCCDFRIASEEAKLGLPEVSLGYIPSAGGTQTLSRLVPPGVAKQIVLTGDPIDADAAYRYGLLHRVVAGDLLYQEAERLARRIASFPPAAVSLAKRAIVEGLDLSLADGLALESKLALRTLRSADGARAVLSAAGMV